jgi:toxin ParE1/3/4
MKRLPVKYRLQANEDFLGIAAYVLARSQNLITARAYADRLYRRCQRIGNVPFGGVARDDLGAGIRMVVFEKSIVILYRVEGDTAWITNIFSGGRNYETLLDHRRDVPPDDL